MVGRASSLQLSKDLGYNFNQVERWLNGTKQCRWDEFWQLCLLLELPLGLATRRVFGFVKEEHIGKYEPLDPPDDEALLFIQFLRTAHAHLSIQQLADKIHVHSSALKRYFRGEIAPDLEVVFSLFNVSPGRLAAFLYVLLGLEGIKEFESFFKDISQMQTSAAWPQASAIEGCLTIEGYQKLAKHSDEFIAEHVGLPVSEVRDLLPILLEKGHIVKEGDKYAVNYETISTLGLNPTEACRFVNYWMKRAALRFSDESQGPISLGETRSLVAYRIVAMSNEASHKVTDLISKTSREILAIVEEDKGPPTEVRVVMMHHFSVKDRPKNS